MNSDLLNFADRDVGVTDPSLAVGLNDIAFYSTELPFINVLKQSGDRANNDGSWSVTVENADGTTTVYDYSQAAHAGFLDENGYIQNLPEGARATLTLFNGVPEEAGTGGRYVFFYEGEGDFSFVGGDIVESLSEPGRVVVDIPNGSSFVLSVNDVDSQDHLRELALVREEHVDLYEAGATFNPDFIDLFEDHRVLRFMDFQETNNSNHIEFADLATEDAAFYGIPANQSYEYVFAKDIEEFTVEQRADLPRGDFTIIFVDPQTGEPFRDADGAIRTDVPTDALPAGIPTGVPISVLVDLANQVGADPWFNIPAQASDDYVRQFAEYVRDNLEPGLVARFEYSNEVWNGQFEQFTYANEKGLELFGDEFGDFPVNFYYGYRSAQILDIVNEVFGDEAPTRVNGILATQTVNIGVLEQSLAGVELYLEDSGQQNLEVNDLFDTVAVTGYFGPVITEGSVDFPGHLQFYRDVIAESVARFESGETTDQYAYFIQQIAQDLRDGSVTQAYFQDALDNGEIQEIPRVFSVADLRELFAANRTIADEFGLTLDQYEGGSHILTSGNLFAETQLLDFLAVLNESTAVAEVQREALIAFREEGGALANDFIGVAQRTQFGPFGTLEHLNDESALFDVFQDFNDNASSLSNPFGDQAFSSLNALEGRDGGVFANSITELGGDGDETLFGGRQDDFLIGGGGDDTLVGGEGEDSLNGGAGFDQIVLSGTVEDYWIAAEGEGYRVTNGVTSDFILNVEAIGFEDGETILVDTFVQGSSSFIEYFGGGVFTASRLFDLENGTQGVSIIIVDPLSQTGNDLAFSPSTDLAVVDNIYYVINGVPDQQTRSIVGSGASNVEDSVEFVSNVGEIVGTDFDDTFEGHHNGEVVDLGAGNDVLYGFGGDDTLSGGDGNDTIFGGDGNDVIAGNNGLNVIDGGEGVDIFVFNGQISQIDIFVDGEGVRLIGDGGNHFLTNVELVSFGDGQLVFVEDLLAGVFENVQYFGGGTYQATSVNGFNGVIITPIEAGTVTGNELGITGEDIPVNQVVYAVFQRDNSAASFEAIHDNGIQAASNVADIVSSVGAFQGTDFNDEFRGTQADEIVNLGGGDDRLSGFAGDDTLDGGAGDDFLGGGDGNDVLIAGTGDDVLNGGLGEDVVVLSGQIEDYTITFENNAFVIEGIDGLDQLFDVELVEFADGSQISLAEWNELNGSTSNGEGGDTPLSDGDSNPNMVQDLDGQVLQVNSTSTAGVVIGLIEVGGATFLELGFDVNVGFTNPTEAVFFVADRANIDASFEAINGGLSSALAVVDLVHNFSSVIGTAFDDFFSGSFGNDSVDLGAGDDRLDGFDGDDVLFGGAGDDFVGGGSGDDFLVGGSGGDVINGGFGNDTVSYADETEAVSINLPDNVFGGSAVGDSLFAVETIIATNQNDFIQLNDSILSVEGGLGNDEIIGGAADNTLLGGEGNDTLNGLDGMDVLEGGVGDDVLVGGLGDDVLNGGEGDDVALYSGSFSDYSVTVGADGTGFVITGLDGSDELFDVERARFEDGSEFVLADLFNGANDFDIDNLLLNGGSGDDELTGGTGDDTLLGHGGEDTLNGLGGADLLEGGSGHDLLNGDDGNDVLFGDDGVDTLNGGLGDDTLNGGAGVDRLFGNEGNDVLNGGEGADVLLGRGGNDILNGGLDDDVLFGQGGDDLLNGDEGNDLLLGRVGDDVLNGGLGDDTLEGDEGNDRLFGNEGNDVLSGGEGADVLLGRGGNDTLYGGLDDDVLFGQGGNDQLNGDEGNDLLLGRVGNDVLNGGLGDDTLEGDQGDDRLFGNEGNDVLNGGSGRDILLGRGDNDTLNGGLDDDVLFGQGGDDVLNGDEGNDLLLGRVGSDVLNGGLGDDTLEGDQEDDQLFGGDGNDVLSGGLGDDLLEGGMGDDVFVFSDNFGADVITDFSNGDVLDLSDVNGITDFQDLADNHFQINEGGVLSIVDDENNTILLEGVEVSDLDSSDFIF